MKLHCSRKTPSPCCSGFLRRQLQLLLLLAVAVRSYGQIIVGCTNTRDEYMEAIHAQFEDYENDCRDVDFELGLYECTWSDEKSNSAKVVFFWNDFENRLWSEKIVVDLYANQGTVRFSEYFDFYSDYKPQVSWYNRATAVNVSREDDAEWESSLGLCIHNMHYLNSIKARFIQPTQDNSCLTTHEGYLTFIRDMFLDGDLCSTLVEEDPDSYIGGRLYCSYDSKRKNYRATLDYKWTWYGFPSEIKLSVHQYPTEERRNLVALGTDDIDVQDTEYFEEKLFFDIPDPLAFYIPNDAVLSMFQTSRQDRGCWNDMPYRALIERDINCNSAHDDVVSYLNDIFLFDDHCTDVPFGSVEGDRRFECQVSYEDGYAATVVYNYKGLSLADGRESSDLEVTINGATEGFDFPLCLDNLASLETIYDRTNCRVTNQEAMDVLYDVFGEDNCDTIDFSNYSILFCEDGESVQGFYEYYRDRDTTLYNKIALFTPDGGEVLDFKGGIRKKAEYTPLYMHIELGLVGSGECIDDLVYRDVIKSIINPAPSSAPSASSAPSLTPSSMPSSAPSLTPSSMPSSAPSLTPSSMPSSAPSLPIACVSESDGSEGLLFQLEMTLTDNDSQSVGWQVVNMVDGSEWRSSGFGGDGGSLHYKTFEFSMCLPINQCYEVKFLARDDGPKRSVSYAALVAGDEALDGSIEVTDSTISHELCIGRDTHCNDSTATEFKYRYPKTKDKTKIRKTSCEEVDDRKKSRRNRKKLCEYKAGRKGQLRIKQKCPESCGKLGRGPCGFLEDYSDTPAPSTTPPSVIEVTAMPWKPDPNDVA